MRPFLKAVGLVGSLSTTQPSSVAAAASDQQPLRGLFCTVAEKVPRKSDHVVNIFYNGNPWQLCLALLVCVLGNIAGRHLSILIMPPFLKAVGLVGSLSTMPFY